MKKLIFLLALYFGGMSCTSQQTKGNDTTIKQNKEDDGEWDLTVIDSQFDYFMNAIAKPKSMYSVETLRNRNRSLVSEWNSYYMSGRYRNIIESSIDYDPNENYGLDFEYKLYQVFAFVNWKYKLRFTGLSAMDYSR